MRWLVVGSAGGSGLQHHIPNKHVEHQSVSHNACNNGITKFTRYSATKHYVGSNTAVNHIMTSTLVNQLGITCTLYLGTALTYIIKSTSKEIKKYTCQVCMYVLYCLQNA